MRQSCLHTKLKESGQEYKWWDYTKWVHQECFGYIDKLCSKRAHNEIGMKFDETMKCVDQSFWDKDYSKAENSILKANSARWKEYGTLYWPSVTIN